MIIHFSHAPSTYLFHPVPKILQNLEVLVLLLGVKAKKKFQQKKPLTIFCSVFASGIFGYSWLRWLMRHFMSENLGKCILGYAWMHFREATGSNRLMWLHTLNRGTYRISDLETIFELGKTYLMLVPSIWNSRRPIESNRRVYQFISSSRKNAVRPTGYDDYSDFSCLMTWMTLISCWLDFFFQIYEKQRFDDLVSFSDSLLSAYF